MLYPRHALSQATLHILSSCLANAMTDCIAPGTPVLRIASHAATQPVSQPCVAVCTPFDSGNNHCLHIFLVERKSGAKFDVCLHTFLKENLGADVNFAAKGTATYHVKKKISLSPSHAFSVWKMYQLLVSSLSPLCTHTRTSTHAQWEGTVKHIIFSVTLISVEKTCT